MGTTAEKLSYTLNSVNDIQAAINEKGVPVDNAVALGVYGSKIREIKSGGGYDESLDRSKPIVRFLYRNRTTGEEVIVSQNVNIGGTATPPSAVGNVVATANNPALTFQRWSNTNLTNIRSNLDVGAMYVTADYDTHFYITLTPATGLEQTIYLNMSSFKGTCTIDWGDGHTDLESVDGNFSFTHTYKSYGNYVVTTSVGGAGTMTMGFGNGTSNTTVFGGSDQSKRNALTQCFIGSGVPSIGTYAFYSSQSLKSITIPNTVTTIGAYALNNCPLLKMIFLIT